MVLPQFVRWYADFQSIVVVPQLQSWGSATNIISRGATTINRKCPCLPTARATFSDAFLIFLVCSQTILYTSQFLMLACSSSKNKVGAKILRRAVVARLGHPYVLYHVHRNMILCRAQEINLDFSQNIQFPIHWKKKNSSDIFSSKRSILSTKFGFFILVKSVWM